MHRGVCVCGVCMCACVYVCVVGLDERVITEMLYLGLGQSETIKLDSTLLNRV